MYLYANGCSMTYGSELCDDPVTKICTDDAYRWEHSWPGVLGALSGAEGVFNDAWPSGSNDRVVRTTVQFVLERWLGQGLPAVGLAVVIGWSHPARREFFVDGSFRQVVPHHDYDLPQLNALVQVYRTTAWHEEESSWRFAIQVLTLRSFLRDHGVRMVFFNAFGDSQLPGGPVGDELSGDYLGFGDADGAMAEVLREDRAHWCGQHPSEAGHAAWARRIHRFAGPLNGWTLGRAALAEAGLPQLGGNASVPRHDVKDGDRAGMRVSWSRRLLPVGPRIRRALRRDPYLYP